MKFNKTHLQTRNDLIIDQQINHISITCTVTDEGYRSYALESDKPIKLWKNKKV